MGAPNLCAFRQLFGAPVQPVQKLSLNRLYEFMSTLLKVKTACLICFRSFINSG